MTLKVTHVLWLGGGRDLPPFSGAENHLWTLLPALRTRRVDVELLVLLWNSGAMIDERIASMRATGVRVTVLQMDTVRRWQMGGLRFPRHILMLARALRERRDRIIHLHLDYFIQPVAAWLAGCKIVGFSIHNDEQWFRHVWARIWLHWLDKHLCGYIAISNRVRDYYQKMAQIPPRKIVRIYYGVEPAAPLASREDIRKQFWIPLDRFVVGFIGRLVYQKNIPLLIEAMRRLPEWHCVIVGDGNARAQVFAVAEDVPNVQFLGFQPDAHKIIPAFDVFCLPSRYEGLGLVLIEAMLNRVPIVASRAGAIPEILQQGKFGRLFDSGDMEGLIAQLKYVQAHPVEMETMVEEAHRYALETFTIASMAEQTIDAYRQWLARDSRTSRTE